MALLKKQEREQLRAEVQAEFQVQAQNFVTEQITLARVQMQQELQQQLNEHKMQSQLAANNSAFGNPRKSFIPFVPMQQQEIEMESASEGTYLIDASNNIDTMSNARQQRRQNQQMGNTIRNVSNSNEFRI